jgi:hypothetical protein
MTDTAKLHRISDVDGTDHYRAIGAFVVAFEKISTALRFQYGCLMQIDGLRTWTLGANLLNIPSIGPEALAIAYCAAVSQVADDAGLRKRADHVLRETKALAELRNQIVHGEWMIGPEVVIISDAPEVPARQGIKRKTGKSGETVTEQPTVPELNDLTARCDAVRKEVQEIFGEIVQATSRRARSLAPRCPRTTNRPRALPG